MSFILAFVNFVCQRRRSSAAQCRSREVSGGGRGYCGVVATVTVGNATAVKFNKIPISFGRTHTHTHNFGNFQTLSVRSGCVSFRFVFTRIFSHSIFHLTFALASLLLCSCAHLIELQTLRSSQFSQLGRSQVEATVPAQLSLPFFAFSSHYSLTPLLPLFCCRQRLCDSGHYTRTKSAECGQLSGRLAGRCRSICGLSGNAAGRRL